MEKEVPENILAKIRKLLRLKESAIKIGSEGEAHAAAEAVNRLLTSYNLSLMDVTPEEQKNMISVTESEKITYQDTYGNIWKRDLLRIICEYNFCRILLHGGTTYMVVVGTRENAEVVLSLYNYLRSVFRRLSVERCTEYVATRRGYYRTKKFKRNYIKSYLLGCCTGLRKQFESFNRPEKLLISPAKKDDWAVVELRNPELAAAIIKDVPEAMVKVVQQPVKVVQI